MVSGKFHKVGINGRDKALSLIAKDFSGERPIRWRLWLVVLALHAVALAGLNAVLALNRLAAQAESSFDVAILPDEAVAAKLKSTKSEPAKPEPAKPLDEAAKAEPPPTEAAPAAPAANALPLPEVAIAATPPVASSAALLAPSEPATGTASMRDR